MTTIQDITSQLTSGMSVDDIRALVNSWDMNVGGGTLTAICRIFILR